MPTWKDNDKLAVCRECDNPLGQWSDAEICLHCRSKKTHCNEGAFYQKIFEYKVGRSYRVPWCDKFDSRAFVEDDSSKMICEKCKYNSGGKDDDR